MYRCGYPKPGSSLIELEKVNVHSKAPTYKNLGCVRAYVYVCERTTECYEIVQKYI